MPQGCNAIGVAAYYLKLIIWCGGVVVLCIILLCTVDTINRGERSTASRNSLQHGVERKHFPSRLYKIFYRGYTSVFCLIYALYLASKAV